MVVVTPSMVTAVFVDKVDANLAVVLLRQTIGIEQSHISFLSTETVSACAGGVYNFCSYFESKKTKAIISSLRSSSFYDEAFCRGDVVVLIRVNGGDTADLASDTLKQCGAIDIDAR